MKLRALVLILSVTAALFGAGCQPTKKTPVDPTANSIRLLEHESVTSESYWPLKVGNSWIYEVDVEGSGADPVEYTMAVTDYKKLGSESSSTVSISKGRKLIEAAEFRFKSDSITQVSSQIHPVAYNPPRTLIKLPYRRGDSCSETTSAPALFSDVPVDQTIVTTSQGEEPVDTNAGRMEAQVVESLSTYSVQGVKYSDKTTSFWVPRIGMVRTFHLVTGSNGAKFQETWRLTGHKIINP